MSREVRMVPVDWQHPRDAQGEFVPMLDTDYADAVRQWGEEELPEWLEGARLWATGVVKTSSDGVTTIAEVVAKAKVDRPYSPIPEPPTYAWWAGDVPERPKREHFMPSWPSAERTHLMMYESVSEGTPISPAFATAEALAKWLTDTGASAFADETATYDQWLAMIRRGSSMTSAVIVDGRWISGVAAASQVGE